MKRTVPTAVLEAKMNRGNEDEENVFLSDDFYELLSLLQRAEMVLIMGEGSTGIQTLDSL